MAKLDINEIVREARRDRRAVLAKIRSLTNETSSGLILAEILTHAPFGDLRIVAAEALSNFVVEEAVVRALVHALRHDKDWHVRSAAVKALGQSSSAVSLTAIQEALTDKAYGVREDAKVVLQAMASRASHTAHKSKATRSRSRRQS